MPPVTTIEEIRRANLKALLAGFRPERKFADLIERSQTQVTQWKNASPDSKTGKPRQLSSEICRLIEEKCGKPEGWMDQQHWGSAQHADAGSGSSTDPVDQDLSHPEPMMEPTTLQWESVVQLKEFPVRFKLAVPDDALAPDTPRGVVLHFSTEADPVIGHGVLVQDAAGGRHVRRYAQGLGGAWRAEARNTAYMTLHSSDGVKLLAVVTGRDSGVV